MIKSTSRFEIIGDDIMNEIYFIDVVREKSEGSQECLEASDETFWAGLLSQKVCVLRYINNSKKKRKKSKHYSKESKITVGTNMCTYIICTRVLDHWSELHAWWQHSILYYYHNGICFFWY